MPTSRRVGVWKVGGPHDPRITMPGVVDQGEPGARVGKEVCGLL